MNLQTETDPKRFANVYDEVTLTPSGSGRKWPINETEYSTPRKKR